MWFVFSFSPQKSTCKLLQSDISPISKLTLHIITTLAVCSSQCIFLQNMVVTRKGFYRNRSALTQNDNFIISADPNGENSTKTATSELCYSFSYMSASAKPEEFVQLHPDNLRIQQSNQDHVSDNCSA